MISVRFLHEVSKILKSTSPEISKLLNDVKTPITNNEFYKLLGFLEIPKVLLYKKDKIIINTYIGEYKLLIDNNEWMSFNPNTFVQLFELYSHHNLAKGHCICTGLGFALREKWLLSKKEVSKITILEKNIEVIDYHKEFNPDLINQFEVIHCDASEYNGKCDTLLLDHYESEPFLDQKNYFYNIRKCSNNIEHSVLWFWPLEVIVTTKLNREDEDFSKKRYKNYLNLTKKYPTLPNITESELNSYCDMYYLFNGLAINTD